MKKIYLVVPNGNIPRNLKPRNKKLLTAIKNNGGSILANQFLTFAFYSEMIDLAKRGYVSVEYR